MYMKDYENDIYVNRNVYIALTFGLSKQEYKDTEGETVKDGVETENTKVSPSVGE